MIYMTNFNLRDVILQHTNKIRNVLAPGMGKATSCAAATDDKIVAAERKMP